MEPEKREERLSPDFWKMCVVFSCLVFVFTLIFFIFIHPIVIFDTDDWWYIYRARKPFPMTSEWNPCRVLPEILMPLCGYFSAFVIYPITHDYIFSQTIGMSLTVSAFIALYIFTFITAVKQRLNLSAARSVFLGLIFFILHFQIFRSQDTNNDYMFSASNATCYFYYIIPSLLNCTLILRLFSRDDDLLEDFFSERLLSQKAVFLITTYFAVFSNLYHSAILMAYCLTGVLWSLYDAVKPGFKKRIQKKDIRAILKKNIVRAVIIAAWLFSAILEMNGQRSESLLGEASPLSTISRTPQTLSAFTSLLAKTHKGLVLIICALIISTLIFSFLSNLKKYDQERNDNLSARFLFCGLIMFLSLLLLCDATAAYRMGMCSTIFGFLFFCLMIVIFMLVNIMRRFKASLILIAFVVVLLMFDKGGRPGSFKESNMIGANPGICAAVSTDIINQIKIAIEEGRNEIALNVLKGRGSDNWAPHALYGANRVMDALYYHGVVDRKIQATFVPSDEMNEKYKIYP